MGEGENVHALGPSLEEDLRTFVHRRSCRIDIINEKDPFFFDLSFPSKNECPSDSPFPLGPAQTHLGSRRLSLLKDPLPTRNPESAADVLGKEESLVEAALPQALGMEWDRDHEVEKISPPVVGEAARHPFSQKGGDVNLPLIFPSVNGFPQRALIGS